MYITFVKVVLSFPVKYFPKKLYFTK